VASRRELPAVERVELGATHSLEGLHARPGFAASLFGQSRSVPAGDPRHDLWVRLTVDSRYAVREVDAALDVTPHDV
jgi:hypothetical protein